MYLHAATITVLTVLLFAFTVYLVGRARGRYAIHAPATSGHPDFDRVFRAHMNTLEQMAAFLPILWLATIHFDPRYASWAGYVWLVGRLWYVLGYARAAQARSMGFLVGSIAFLALVVMAIWGIARAFMAA